MLPLSRRFTLSLPPCRLLLPAAISLMRCCQRHVAAASCCYDDRYAS